MSSPRSARQPSESRVLRVFFDLGHEWALWESGLGGSDRQPSDYGFSSELTALLRRWYAAWAPIADYDIEQTDLEPTEEERRIERDLAQQAVAGIRRQVPPGLKVRVV